MAQRHIPLGYRMNNGLIEFHDMDAHVVKAIFMDYRAGASLLSIAKKITKEGVLNGNQKPSWNHGSVGKIINNEIYKGNEIYPRLIEDDIFERVQEIRSEFVKAYGRTKEENLMKKQGVFSGKIRCGECGDVYKKYFQSGGSKSGKTIWKCKKYFYKQSVTCRNVFLTDEELKTVFVLATNQLINKRMLFGKSQIQEPPKMSVELRTIENCIKLIEQDEDFSNPNYSTLIFRRAQMYYEGSKIFDFRRNTEIMKQVLEDVNELVEFEELMFETIIKQMSVHRDATVQVEFINGIMITIAAKV